MRKYIKLLAVAVLALPAVMWYLCFCVQSVRLIYFNLPYNGAVLDPMFGSVSLVAFFIACAIFICQPPNVRVLYEGDKGNE